MHGSRRPRRLGFGVGLALGLGSASCDCFYEYSEEPVPSFTEAQIIGCLEPKEWLGKSCDDVCHDADAEVSCVDECALSSPMVGWRRLDACVDMDPRFTTAELSCDDVLGEELTDSVYFVTCCCRRTGS